MPNPAPVGPWLFARVDRFHVECPNCLTIIVSDVDPKRATRIYKRGKRLTGRQARATANPFHPYNPYLQQLRCPTCERIYFVGLLLWQPRANTRSLNKPPLDTVPTPQQRAQLRQLARSTFGRQRKRAGDPVNVHTELEDDLPELAPAPAPLDEPADDPDDLMDGGDPED